QNPLVLRDVAGEQLVGELVLVAEMVEEPAFGDAGLGDDLVDRGRAETLLQDGCARNFEYALARGGSLAHVSSPGKPDRRYGSDLASALSGLRPPMSRSAPALDFASVFQPRISPYREITCLHANVLRETAPLRNAYRGHDNEQVQAQAATGGRRPL